MSRLVFETTVRVIGEPKVRSSELVRRHDQKPHILLDWMHSQVSQQMHEHPDGTCSTCDVKRKREGVNVPPNCD